MYSARKALALMHERFPSAFAAVPEQTRPLKVGIRADLLQALPDLPEEAIGKALACHCRLKRYLRAVVDGGARVGLDGQPAGEVSAEQVAAAQEKLRVLREQKEEREKAHAERVAQNLAREEERHRAAVARKAAKAKKAGTKKKAKKKTAEVKKPAAPAPAPASTPASTPAPKAPTPVVVTKKRRIVPR